jgi:starch synthase
LKIGTVIPWFPSHVSGEKLLGIFQYREAKKLVEMGHEIFIMTIQRPNMPKFEIMDGITVYRFPSYTISKIGYEIPHFPKLTQIIKKVCNEHKLDVLEFDKIDFLTSIPALYIKKKISNPIIITVNGLPGISWFSGNRIVDGVGYVYTNLIGKRIIKAGDGVRLLHSSLYDNLLKFGVDGERMKTIHRGVDTTVFHPYYDGYDVRKELGIEEKDFFILFVGRLIKMKGIEYLIRALKDLISQYGNLKLVIVGDGNAREDNERMASSIRENVIFAGYRNDVYRFMCAADIVVLPSLCEGCPNVVLEAMACGTPVIASRVGAVPDIIENGRTGIIVELKDVEGLKKALVRLMENRELARKMGERGRERVEKEFTWDAVCKKLEKFYGEVVRRDV